MLTLSLTAIEHFHAELCQTNICCVTRRLSVGIIQARCSCFLLNKNFRIICRSLRLFPCFYRKIQYFLKHFMATYKNKVFNIMYGKVWLDGDFFVRNMDASVELQHYKSHLRRKFFLFFTEWYSFFLLWAFFFFFLFFFTKDFFPLLIFPLAEIFPQAKSFYEWFF